MKGLGRDVKKKISRLKPNRVSRDADQVRPVWCPPGRTLGSGWVGVSNPGPVIVLILPLIVILIDNPDHPNKTGLYT